ncbi:MAG: hypothetical protein A2W91_08635 [Bacteroidetes bacterium GWF2_38_335]|nr:MAG: hypothetical protein A2W91_08635 [Bacteroidetes bacterium GWF2_38_335]OFY80556.1 MAG: hypothetical protein A2281_08360 [Bacteroidetes bacterium RIFOXYA12_FULL_38_20]
MKKIVIIDDEKRARDSIRSILQQHFNEIEICGEADSVSSGIEVIHEINPDLVLLDIQLKDGTGFSLLNQLTEIHFRTIFITGYENYAIKAIKIDALDYILKPIDPFELITAIKKFLEQEPVITRNIGVKTNLIKNLITGHERVSIKTSDSIFFVEIKSIIRCQSERNYTNIIFDTGKKMLTSKTLRDYELMLEGYGFLRVHQSHLINIRYITKFDKSDGGYFIMTDGFNVPVSQKNKAEILGFLDHIF